MNEREGDWEELIRKIRDPCPGCPRDRSKVPVVFGRKDLSSVDFVIVSQEPGHWLRSIGNGEAEQVLVNACMNESASSPIVKRTNPLSKVLQMFGNLDPIDGRVYWTHALKCIPSGSDRDINKEWRKAATRCEEHLLNELRSLGRTELNIIVFGKFALEMCLHAFDSQDIDQDLSISEFMQSTRLPLTFKYKFRDGTAKTVDMFVFTNPSSEVVKIVKSGGRMTVEEIQDLEVKRIHELLQRKERKGG